MKAYILTEEDFERLSLRLQQDPAAGQHGGGASGMTREENIAHDKAARFFTYHVLSWLAEVKK